MVKMGSHLPMHSKTICFELAKEKLTQDNKNNFHDTSL